MSELSSMTHLNDLRLDGIIVDKIDKMSRSELKIYPQWHSIRDRNQSDDQSYHTSDSNNRDNLLVGIVENTCCKRTDDIFHLNERSWTNQHTRITYSVDECWLRLAGRPSVEDNIDRECDFDPVDIETLQDQPRQLLIDEQYFYCIDQEHEGTYRKVQDTRDNGIVHFELVQASPVH